MERTIEAVVFDMDGTLLDTERPASRAWAAAVAEVGVCFPEGFYDTIIGRNRADYYLRLHEDIDQPDKVDALVEAMTRQYHALIDREGLALRPGVRKTLDELAARSIPMTVATSTGRKNAFYKLGLAGIDGYFQGVVAGDDVSSGKPHPEIFLKAVQLLGLEPSACMAVEDSLNGILSAVTAGLPTVWVPDFVPVPDEVVALAWKRFERIDAILSLLDGASGDQPRPCQERAK